MQNITPLAEVRSEHGEGESGELAYGIHAQIIQSALSAPAYIQQIAYIKPPRYIFEVILSDHGYRVGLFVIAAEFSEYLIEADAYADGYPQLALYPAPYLVSYLYSVHIVCADVQPRLIKSERLYEIGIIGVYAPAKPRKPHVSLKMRLDNYQIGTFGSSLPYSFACFDLVFFCRFIFSEDYTVSFVGVAAYGYGFISYIRVVQTFNSGIKTVTVTVKYSTHIEHLLEQTFYIAYIIE